MLKFDLIWNCRDMSAIRGFGSTLLTIIGLAMETKCDLSCAPAILWLDRQVDSLARIMDTILLPVIYNLMDRQCDFNGLNRSINFQVESVIVAVASVLNRLQKMAVIYDSPSIDIRFASLELVIDNQSINQDVETIASIDVFMRILFFLAENKGLISSDALYSILSSCIAYMGIQMDTLIVLELLNLYLKRFKDEPTDWKLLECSTLILEKFCKSFDVAKIRATILESFMASFSITPSVPYKLWIQIFGFIFADKPCNDLFESVFRASLAQAWLPNIEFNISELICDLVNLFGRRYKAWDKELNVLLNPILDLASIPQKSVIDASIFRIFDEILAKICEIDYISACRAILEYLAALDSEDFGEKSPQASLIKYFSSLPKFDILALFNRFLKISKSDVSLTERTLSLQHLILDNGMVRHDCEGVDAMKTIIKEYLGIPSRSKSLLPQIVKICIAYCNLKPTDPEIDVHQYIYNS